MRLLDVVFVFILVGGFITGLYLLGYEPYHPTVQATDEGIFPNYIEVDNS